jgi:hypothetical protein
MRSARLVEPFAAMAMTIVPAADSAATADLLREARLGLVGCSARCLGAASDELGLTFD